MLIESYSFGRMVVEDEEYRDDLMICGKEVNPDWVRKRGHELHPEDITWITGKDPELLVVGTGSSGRMKVTDETKTLLDENGIDLWIGSTEEAADYFNTKRKEESEEKIAGAFHLTC